MGGARSNRILKICGAFHGNSRRTLFSAYFAFFVAMAVSHGSAEIPRGGCARSGGSSAKSLVNRPKERKGHERARNAAEMGRPVRPRAWRRKEDRSPFARPLDDSRLSQFGHSRRRQADNQEPRSGPAGCAPHGRSGSAHGCRSWSFPHPGAPAAPARCGYRSPSAAGESRRSAAARGA